MTDLHQEIDWNGEWRGHYKFSDKYIPGVLNNHASPFTLILRKFGNKIEGTCDDVVTTIIYRLRDTVDAAAQIKSNFDIEGYKKLLIQFPEAETVQKLPSKASIKGFIDKDRFLFTKTYIGKTINELVSQGKVLWQFETDSAEVEYSGVINSTKAQVEGEWAIYQSKKILLWQSRTIVNAGPFEVHKYPLKRA